MATPQLCVTTTDSPHAIAINMPAPRQPRSPAVKRYQKKIRGLAIAELVYGSVCMIFGAVIAGIVGTDEKYYEKYHHYPHYYFPFPYYHDVSTISVSMITTGEGIWCGIWVIVAGAIGIRAGKLDASKSLVTCHLVFSIIGSIFSGAMFIMGVVFGIENESFADLLVLYSLLCAGSLSSLVLLVLGSGFSCAALGCCCNVQPEANTGSLCRSQVVQSAHPAAAVGVPTVMYTQNTALQGRPIPTVPYGSSCIVQGHTAAAQPIGAAQSSIIDLQPEGQTIVNQVTLPSDEKNISKNFANFDASMPPSYDDTEPIAQ